MRKKCKKCEWWLSMRRNGKSGKVRSGWHRAAAPRERALKELRLVTDVFAYECFAPFSVGAHKDFFTVIAPLIDAIVIITYLHFAFCTKGGFQFDCMFFYVCCCLFLWLLDFHIKVIEIDYKWLENSQQKHNIIFLTTVTHECAVTVVR